ncbi:hypothetical protein ACPXCS_26640 [Streptomyces sp. DT190]|uniref:hypothetical protein n=1 Tax=unclassified Streptomyces TaxID=2593676 RepID=UPI003CE7525D
MSPLKAACVLALTTVLTLAAAPAHGTAPAHGYGYGYGYGAGHGLGARHGLGAGHGHDSEPELVRTYAATRHYQHVQRAVRDGYLPAGPCAALPGVGAMGHHYVKQRLINSTDPVQPAAIVYHEDKHGKLRAGAVEWIVRDADQKVGTDRDRPVMFGERRFEGPEEIPGLGVVYTLHAWIFTDNPRGVFHPWNPRVHCP